jgi:hypothetical protein
MLLGCTLLLAAAVVGCRDSGGTKGKAAEDPDEALVKEWIRLVDEMADILERFPGASKTEVFRTLEARARELKQQEKALPKERQEALEKKYGAQARDAHGRLAPLVFRELSQYPQKK